MTSSGRWARIDRRLAAAMRGACIAAFAMVIVLVTTLILLRFAPLFSLGWADEIVEMAFAWLTFLGTAALWRSRAHFRVDLIPGMLARTRLGRALEILLSLTALAFSEKSSAETREISEGVVLDYDAEGTRVGIDIDNASSKVHLKELTLSRLPVDIHVTA